MNKDSLKHQAFSGLFWSALGLVGNRGSQFLVQIILARLLFPEEFGLVAMVIVFITIALGITDAGFSQAVIQRQNLSAKDLSSVFFFNLFLSWVTATLLWLLAPFISEFYNEPRLTLILKILTCTIILDAFGRLQLTLLQKHLLFREILKITMPSIILSGIVGIVMAYYGMGVWAIVGMNISQKLCQTLFLWTNSQWKPKFEFSKESIISLFPFGSRLAASSIINLIFEDIYVLLIGKSFSPADVGLYFKANSLKKNASMTLSGIISSVTFPLFSKLQDDKKRLRIVFIRMIVIMSLISFSLMGLLAGISLPLITVLLGEKWILSSLYLKYLCIPGALYIISVINLSTIMSLGHSKIYLQLEVIKKILYGAMLCFTYKYSVLAIVMGLSFVSVLAFIINCYFSGKYLNITLTHQFKKMFSQFCLGVFLFIATSFFPKYLNYTNNLIILLFSIALGFLIILIFLFMFKQTYKNDIKYFSDNNKMFKRVYDLLY